MEKNIVDYISNKKLAHKYDQTSKNIDLLDGQNNKLDFSLKLLNEVVIKNYNSSMFYCYKIMKNKKNNDFTHNLLFNAAKSNIFKETLKVIRYLENTYFSIYESKEDRNTKKLSDFYTLKNLCDDNELKKYFNHNFNEMKLDCENDKKRYEYNEKLMELDSLYADIKNGKLNYTREKDSIDNNALIQSLKETIMNILNHIKNVEHEQRCILKSNNKNFERKLINKLSFCKKITNMRKIHKKKYMGDKCIRRNYMKNVEKIRLEMKLKKKLNTIYEASKYMEKCEQSYTYLKYIMLFNIAFENNICRLVRVLSDEKKFKNFRLYLELLFKQTSNMTFNRDNSDELVKEVVKTACLYYENGIINQSLVHIFYKHPNYIK